MPVRPVDWAAVFAGAVLATALGLILLGFGAALGLSVTSPYEGEGMSPVAYAIAAGLYLLWVQLLSFSIGGYVAARLRPRNETSEQETDVRDGLHGLLAWGVGVIAAAVIAFAGVSGATAAARTADNPRDLAASVAGEAQERIDQAAGAEARENPEAAGSALQERRAEIARKLTVISGFVTAASLLLGAVAAFFFAGVGGRHRDENVTVRLFALRPSSKLW